jgi:hypothetical protein
MHCVIAFVVVALASGTAVARKPQGRQERQTDEDRRELDGRALFAKGDYQAALEIYATLFAEKSNPLFLRNIGRCHQRLKQPEKAIDAFREYLRRAKVEAAERAEVDGFIREMEEQQKRQAATTPPATGEAPASPPGANAATPTAAPLQAVPAADAPAAGTARGTTLTKQAEPVIDSSASQGSIVTKWWFWTGLAVVVAGGAVTAFALTRPESGLTPPCPDNITCSSP